jgi:hypothetical protein
MTESNLVADLQALSRGERPEDAGRIADRVLSVLSIGRLPDASPDAHRWAVSREDDAYVEVPGHTGGVRSLQASVGGPPELGHYLVFRGEPGEIADMLEQAAVLARAVANGKQSVQDKRRRKR